MAMTANAIARVAITAVGLMIVTETEWAGRPALAAEGQPVAPAPVVAGGGVTLHSIDVSSPNSDSTFPGVPGLTPSTTTA